MKHPLAVTINLNTEQTDTLAMAVKGKPFNPFSRNNTVEVTADNVLHVRESVVQLFRTKFKQKTKTAQTLAICFACERIIDKIDNILSSFGYEAPEEPTNDNEIGIVSISIPSLTKVEEEQVDADASGIMQSIPSLTDVKNPESPKGKLINTIANKPAKSKGNKDE